MDRRVTHPTKEQVRAYMLAREHDVRPPPPPDEIRRQLDWHVVSSEPDLALVSLCLLPARLGQFAMQAALGWCFVPLAISDASRH